MSYVTCIMLVNKVVLYEGEWSVSCPDHSSTSPTGRNSLNRAQAASLLRILDHKQLRPLGFLGTSDQLVSEAMPF